MTNAPERVWIGPSVDDKGVYWDVGHWVADRDEDDLIPYVPEATSKAAIAAAYEAAKREAEQIGYERGVRDAANADSKLEDLNFDDRWTLYEHGVHEMQAAIMALIKPTAQEDAP